MLRERTDDLATARERRAAYEAALAEVVRSVGVERAAGTTGVEPDRLDALGTDGDAGLTVGEAAGILGLTGRWPDRETAERELRDDLVVGMSNAAVDAAAVARAAGPGVDEVVVRDAVEGDRDLGLAEYARIRQYLAAEAAGEEVA